VAALSNALFDAGLVLVIVSAVLHGVSALPLVAALPAAATGEGTVIRPVRPLVSPTKLRGLGSSTAALAAVALVGVVVTRTMIARRPPYGDMYEYLVTFGTAALVAFVIVERRASAQAFGLLFMPLIAGTLLAARVFFPSDIVALSPALQNNRLLGIHVASMILAYAAFSVAFAGSVAVVAQQRRRLGWMPDRRAAESLQHHGIRAGFLLLALGILLGAYWGNIAWGRYWGWDPKETTALASWLIYAGFMHTESLGRWRGARSAWIAIGGYALIVFNIFVVNFLIAGLHSYAGG
jgi:cytochrome c-type biogenesis protein CcsB